MQVTAGSLYAIPEQFRRYSVDTSLSPQPHAAPAYCPNPPTGYFPQEAAAGRSRILSFSEGKRKGDLMDFYVKYKTEVVLWMSEDVQELGAEWVLRVWGRLRLCARRERIEAKSPHRTEI